MNETRDVLLSVALGFGLVLLFASTIGLVWLVAFAAARARDWWERRRPGGAA